MAADRVPVHHTHPGVENPSVRATAPDGDIWDEPSEDLLFELVNDCEYPGDFVIVEKDGDHFAQTAYAPSSPWVVEFRDGSADEHYQAWTEDRRLVHEVLFGFAYDRPGWKGLLDWTKIEFE